MLKCWNLRCLSKFFLSKNSSTQEPTALVIKPCSQPSQVLCFTQKNSSDHNENSHNNNEGKKEKKTCHESETVLPPTLFETLSWVGTAFTLQLNWKLSEKKFIWDEEKSHGLSIFIKKWTLSNIGLNQFLWRVAFAMPNRALNEKFVLPNETQKDVIKPKCHVVGDTINTEKKKSNQSNLSKKNDHSEKALLSIEEATKELETATIEYFSHLETMAGLQAIKSNKRKGFLHLKKGARLGNPKANFNLGICYETGLGTQIDLEKAAEHYTSASNAGHDLATYNLGVFYLEGRGNLKKDYEKGICLIKKASDGGVVQAEIYMGLHYTQLEKWDLAFPLFKNAAEKDPEAQYYLATCYENGLGVESNLDKAKQLFKKAKSAGFTQDVVITDIPNDHVNDKVNQINADKRAYVDHSTNHLPKSFSDSKLIIPKYLDDLLINLQTTNGSQPIFWIGDSEECINYDLVAT